jgi:hypothetical protein
MAIVAGLVGSFVGGLLISLLAGDGLELRASGIIGSLVGALIITALWRWWDGRSKGLVLGRHERQAVRRPPQVAPEVTRPRTAPGPMGDDLLVERRDLRPYADYHVHLLGPFALPLPDPLRTEVTVPADVRTLLDARAALSGSVRTASQCATSSPATRSCAQLARGPNRLAVRDEWFERLPQPRPARQVAVRAHRFEVEGGFGHVAGTVLDVRTTSTSRASSGPAPRR